MPEDQCTLEAINGAIKKYMVQYDQLLSEQRELASSRDEQRLLGGRFRERHNEAARTIEDDKSNFFMDIESEKETLEILKQQQSQLRRDIETENAAFCELQGNHNALKKQSEASTALPEKEVVFTQTTWDAANPDGLDLKTRVIYPMEGGTALITFEEEIVAQKILSMREHRVGLGEECFITAVAEPVQLIVPSYVEMDTRISSRRVLVSNLPDQDGDSLLDKLEIHFGKSRNGGGEVEDREIQDDSGGVVITFCDTNVAKGLIDKQHHEVEFGKGNKHKVKVTPFLNGEIRLFKTKLSVCARTVLLTGIPAVMAADGLMDLLEIHFQKGINGGGEVEAILYNPLGACTMALFEGDSSPERLSPADMQQEEHPVLLFFSHDSFR